MTVILLLTTGFGNTLAAFTASITNNNNNLHTGSVSLSENGGTCTAPSDGQWHNCSVINKYIGGPLPGTAAGTTVTLQNTGTLPARLFLLPSSCTDSLTGAGGEICDDVDVTVTCTLPAPVGTVTVFGPGSLNAFHTGNNWPTGYPVGSTALAPGAQASCTFALTRTITPSEPGSVSQPLSWRLTLA